MQEFSIFAISVMVSQILTKSNT